MRVSLKWALPLLVVMLLLYLIKGVTNTLDRKQKMTELIQQLPAFTAYKVDSSRLTNAELISYPVVLIYFDPDCDHCQREARELRQRFFLLTTAKVLMLSSAPLPALRNFSQTYQLGKLPNVQVAHIDRLLAQATFGFTSVPAVLIYHADGSLAKRFQGETSVEAIARSL